MYLRTYDGLGQVPMLHGSFAGTLGANQLPADIRAFLNQVRNRPHGYRRLLLTVAVHPQPGESMIFNSQTFTFGKQVKSLIDSMLLSEVPAGDVFDEIRRIGDARFKHQIEAERQLRNEMIKTTGELLTSEMLKTRGNLLQNKTLTSFLLEALRAEDSLYPRSPAPKLSGVALSFALRMLPPKLANRIRDSKASEAHLTSLGRFLRRYAEEWQKKQKQQRSQP